MSFIFDLIKDVCSDVVSEAVSSSPEEGVCGDLVSEVIESALVNDKNNENAEADGGQSEPAEDT